MNGVVTSLTSYYANGLSVDESLPIEDKIEILRKEDPGPLVRITWTVDNRAYTARAGLLNEDEITYFSPIAHVKRGLFDWRRRQPSPSSQQRFVSFHLLPDGSGFVRFESGWDRTDNCLLLDACGKERMRLSVPWQLTKHPNPESAKPPTSFDNVSDPCINPADGKPGKFGVSAWVEHAGKYYFELDYHTGQFLWGKEIRD